MQYYLPLNNKICEPSACCKRWYSIAAMDAVLQLCLVTFIGVAFLSSWPVDGDRNSRSLYQERVEDTLVLLVFSLSFVYIVLAIGVCCFQPESRFFSMLSENIVVVSCNNNPATDDDRHGSTKENLAIVARYNEPSSMQSNLTESSLSHIPRKKVDFCVAGTDFARNYRDTSSYPGIEEYCDVLKSQTNSLHYLVGDDYKQEGERKHRNPSESRLELLHDDSSMVKNERKCDSSVEDDAETVYEEIWIDEETGKEILDPKKGKWMDVGTGLVAVPPKQRNHKR